QAAALHAWVTADPGLHPADVGLSLALGRSRFAERAVLVGEDRGDLLDALAALSRGEAVPDGGVGVEDPASRTVLVFPGQGTQWVGMARELLADSPVFAACMAECDTALSAYVEWSLLDVVGSSASLERVDVVQPVLFAVMLSLAAVWRSHGVEPDAVVGHSQGEIAAAVVAGGLSVQDWARGVAVRSQPLRVLPVAGGT